MPWSGFEVSIVSGLGTHVYRGLSIIQFLELPQISQFLMFGTPYDWNSFMFE